MISYYYLKGNLYIYVLLAIIKSILEWVKCIKFLRINEAEIVDESSQNRVMESGQIFIHMPNKGWFIHFSAKEQIPKLL